MLPYARRRADDPCMEGCMIRSIRKHLRLALMGAASAAVFGALAFGAQAQIPVTCNSDFSNDFTCGVSAATGGGSSTAVGDHASALDPNGTAYGASSSTASSGTAVGFFSDAGTS